MGKKLRKRWLLVLLSVLLVLTGCTVGKNKIVSEGIEIEELVKEAGKDFKILQVTDIQLHLPNTTEKEAFRQISELVDSHNPDLIVLTGDNITGGRDDFLVPAIIEFMGNLGVPWAISYGNHDPEGYKGIVWQSEQYANAKNSLFQTGPTDIFGYGNYIINIKEGEKTIYSIFVMDSNGYDVDENLEEIYAFIREDQIEWYEENVKNISKEEYGSFNPEQGKVVPSLMFFHIPVPEYRDAYKIYEKSGFSPSMGKGENNEDVYCSDYNSGLFDKILELGSTKGIFVGHDHINDSEIMYKDVILAYGVKTGSGSYWNPKQQGGTIITIKDKTNEIEIENIYLENKAFDKDISEPQEVLDLLGGEITSYEEDYRKAIEDKTTFTASTWVKAKKLLEETQ